MTFFEKMILKAIYTYFRMKFGYHAEDWQDWKQLYDEHPDTLS